MDLFNWFDYSLMAAYAAGLLLITFWFKRAASQGLNDYFLGGRKLPWWALGFGGMTSMLDMAGTMLLVSLLLFLGPQGLYVEVRGGLALLMAFAMVFHGKWNRRSGCMTVAEWMEFRFGSGRAGQLARLIEAVAMLVTTVGMLAYFVKGSGLFLSLFLPFSPEMCALGLVAIATVYTVLTGFYGVIYTDLFQVVFIVAGAVIIAIDGFNVFPDAASLQAAASSVTGNANWGSMSLPFHVDMPEAYKGFEMLALAVVYYLFYTILIGISRSGGRPVYFGARNERDCGKLSLLWLLASTVRWPLIAGFVLLAIHMSLQLFPDPASIMDASTSIRASAPEVAANSWGQHLNSVIHQPEQHDPALYAEMETTLGTDWKKKLPLVGYHGTLDFEQALPAVIAYVIPVGLRGLIFIALIAAAMSTFDNQVNMAAAYFVRDIYQRQIHPAASNATLIRVSHVTSVVIVAISFFVGYHAKSINDIWGWIMMGLGGGLALPGVLRWIWWRFNGIGYASGVFAGMLAAIVQRLWFPDLPVWLAFPAILSCSFVALLLGTFLSDHADPATVLNFYRTTRPFGLWGPVRRKVTDEERRSIDRENRFDIAATCVAVPWQFFLYWVPVTFMFKLWDGFWTGVAVLVVTSIALYFLWYRQLPPESAPATPAREDSAARVSP